MSQIIVCGGVVADSIQTAYGSGTYQAVLGGGAFTAATTMRQMARRKNIVTLVAEISNDPKGNQFVSTLKARNVRLVPELLNIDRPTRTAVWDLTPEGKKSLDQAASILSPSGESRLDRLATLDLGEPEIIVLCSSDLTMKWEDGWKQFVKNHPGPLVVSSFNTRAFKSDDPEKVKKPLTADEKRAIYELNFRDQMQVSDIAFFAAKDLECLRPGKSRADVIAFLQKCNPECSIVITNGENSTEFYPAGDSVLVSIPVKRLSLPDNANKVGTGDAMMGGTVLTMLQQNDFYNIPPAIKKGHSIARAFLMKINNMQPVARPAEPEV